MTLSRSLPLAALAALVVAAPADAYTLSLDAAKRTAMDDVGLSIGTRAALQATDVLDNAQATVGVSCARRSRLVFRCDVLATVAGSDIRLEARPLICARRSHDARRRVVVYTRWRD